MQARRLHGPRWLVAEAVPDPQPGPGQVLIRAAACAVCRTDLHVVDGELPAPKPCVIPGHEIVGRVVAAGPGAERFAAGVRVGVPWLGHVCGSCRYCRAGQENLCAKARFAGYQLDGGYAEYAVAEERFCLPIPEAYGEAEAAPLLCAGLIGHRALRMAGETRRLGIYGFGAAAHIVAQVARHEGREVYAFTRGGDSAAQDVARGLSAVWARSGPAARRRRRRSRSTRPSSSLRSGRWCRPRCGRWTAAAWWSAPGSIGATSRASPMRSSGKSGASGRWPT